MPIVFKSTLSSSVANDTFLDKTIDDATIGVFSLNNITNVDSGSFIANAQRYINEIADSDGTLGEGDATRKIYSSNNFIADGDNRKVTIGKLDTQLKITDDLAQLNETNITAIENSVGQPNGIASLDGSGVVPIAQIPQEAFDGLSPKGSWNADTNTPDLSALSPNIGDYYLVSVAGSTSLGGITVWEINDWAVFTDSGWVKNIASPVTSVNSQIGAVVLDADDIAETTRYWDIKHNNTAVIDPTSGDDIGDGYSVGSTWFNSVNGKKFTLQDATLAAAIWIETSGTGSGQGSFSYITNFGAEDNVDGYVVYANTTPSDRPDDFGGVPNVGFTWTRNTADPLINSADFLLTKPAANVSGNGIYYQFTAEKAHLAMMHLFSVFNDTTNLGDDDISIWLVSSNDSFVADFNIISSAVPNAAAGTPRTFKQFQFDATDLDYRLCIHWNSTDTTAKTANFDDFFLGPKESVTSAVVTDWQDYTPVTQGIGTPTITRSKWRQVGDSIELDVKFTTGTSTAVEFQYGLPNGMVAHSSYTANSFLANLELDSGDNFSFTIITTGGDSFVNSGLRLTGTPNAFVPQTGSGNFAAGRVVAFKASIKIEGLSSNAITSENFGGREVIIEGRSNVGQAITANVTDIPFTVTRDTIAGWDGSKFLCKETGVYPLDGMVAFTTGSTRQVSAYVNGVIRKTIGYNASSTSIHEFNGKVYLEAGEELSVRVDQGGTLSVFPNGHHIIITKDNSPQTILDTARASTKVINTAAPSIPNGVWTKVTGYTKLYDDRNSFDTTVSEFTSPISDKFSTSIKAHWAASAAGQRGIRLRINGLDTGIGSFVQSNAALTTAHGASDDIELSIGDILTIEVFQNSGAALSLLAANDINNSFSIHRIK